MNLNNPLARVGIDGRTCLKGALCSLPTLLWTNAFGRDNAKNIAPNPFDTPSQNILVGYIPSEIVDTGPTRLNELLRVPEVGKPGELSAAMGQATVAAKSPETARAMKLSELSPSGKFEKGR